MPAPIPVLLVAEEAKYAVYAHENEHRFLRGIFKYLLDATRYAKRQWDDALPHNTVWVYEVQGGTHFVPIGCVSSTGDGGCEYEEVPNAIR